MQLQHTAKDFAAAAGYFLITAFLKHPFPPIVLHFVKECENYQRINETCL